MHILLNVSTETLLTMKIPIGIPIRTGGAIIVNRDKLVALKRPKK